MLTVHQYGALAPSGRWRRISLVGGSPEVSPEELAHNIRRLMFHANLDRKRQRHLAGNHTSRGVPPNAANARARFEPEVFRRARQSSARKFWACRRSTQKSGPTASFPWTLYSLPRHRAAPVACFGSTVRSSISFGNLGGFWGTRW
jgi:hypothetical protein